MPRASPVAPCGWWGRSRGRGGGRRGGRRRAAVVPRSGAGAVEVLVRQRCRRGQQRRGAPAAGWSCRDGVLVCRDGVLVRSRRWGAGAVRLRFRRRDARTLGVVAPQGCWAVGVLAQHAVECAATSCRAAPRPATSCAGVRMRGPTATRKPHHIPEKTYPQILTNRTVISTGVLKLEHVNSRQSPRAVSLDHRRTRCSHRRHCRAPHTRRRRTSRTQRAPIRCEPHNRRRRCSNRG